MLYINEDDLMFSLIMLCCSLLIETVNEDKYVGRREIENNSKECRAQKGIKRRGASAKAASNVIGCSIFENTLLIIIALVFKLENHDFDRNIAG